MIPKIKSKKFKFILRKFRKGDEKSLSKNINDKEISKYTTRIPHPYRLKDAKKWIAHSIKEHNKKKLREINFVIDINEDVAGSISLMNIESHKAEIGYWLAKKYWNKGIMTEAVKLVANFGFSKLKLNRIYAPVFSFNKKSARVLEKNKFAFEGLMKKFHNKDEKLYDALLFAKVK